MKLRDAKPIDHSILIKGLQKELRRLDRATDQLVKDRIKYSDLDGGQRKQFASMANICAVITHLKGKP